MDKVKFFLVTPTCFLSNVDVFAIGERYEKAFRAWVKANPFISARIVDEWEAAMILMEYEDRSGIGCYVPAYSGPEVAKNKWANAASQVRLQAFLSRHLKVKPGRSLPTYQLPSTRIAPKPAPRPILRIKTPQAA